MRGGPPPPPELGKSPHQSPQAELLCDRMEMDQHRTRLGFFSVVFKERNARFE